MEEYIRKAIERIKSSKRQSQFNAYLEKVESRQERNKSSKQNSNASDNEKPITKNKNDVNVASVLSVPSVSIAIEVNAALIQNKHEAKITTIDIEHDDHAEKHVITTAAAASLFVSSKPCNGESVRGVVPGIVAPILQRGDLIHEMGEGITIKGANRNLASGPELSKAYDIVKHNASALIYQHKVNGAQLIFRKDPIRFNDNFYHLLIEISNDTVVASLDFYNPKPLAPVIDDAARKWELIHAVEALHWSKNHASSQDMLKTISDPSYIGPVTPEAIQLFTKHRGCSACVEANMKSHTQSPTTRELCKVVGEVVQGDLFYIEDGVRPIPVLILICEASKFMFLYTFLSAAARAKPNAKRVMVTIPEIEVAFSQALVLWAHAGRTMKTIRFDREAAVATNDVKAMLLGRGVEVRLTAAGQKLGLIEVSGRIVKERGRATICGIHDRFGYQYSERFYPRLTGDVVKVLKPLPSRWRGLDPSSANVHSRAQTRCASRRQSIHWRGSAVQEAQKGCGIVDGSG